MHETDKSYFVMTSLIRILILSLIYLVFINKALGLTPNHQEACCFALLRGESTESLGCQTHQLNLEKCKILVKNFSEMALGHQNQLKKIEEQKSKEENSSIRTQSDLNLQKRSSLSNSDKQMIFGFFIFVLIAVSFFLLRKKLEFFRRLTDKFVRVIIIVVNAMALVWLVGASSLKILCMLGDLCRTSNIMIWYLFPSAALAFYISIKYVKSRWKNQTLPLSKDFLIMCTLLIVIIGIYFFKVSIP